MRIYEKIKNTQLEYKDGLRIEREEGEKIGERRGERRGRKEGRDERSREIAEVLKRQGVSHEIITISTGLTESEIKKL